MDGSRFDEFTRLFGSTRTRRNVLKTAAGGVLAAVTGTSRSGDVAAAICPARVPNPAHTPSFNGCGTATFPVSGQIGAVDVTPACNHHDICYDTCNASKSTCDSAFLQEMRAICAAGNAKGSRALTDCLTRANQYYQAVAFFGGGAYNDAQSAACICCAKKETVCGGNCLPACPTGMRRNANCQCSHS